MKTPLLRNNFQNDKMRETHRVAIYRDTNLVACPLGAHQERQGQRRPYLCQSGDITPLKQPPDDETNKGNALSLSATVSPTPRGTTLAHGTCFLI